MSKRNVKFRTVYLIYLGILAVLVTAALLYVRGILHQYEESQPEFQVAQAAAELKAKAADGTFWETYALPEAENAPEDVKTAYLSRFAAEDLQYTLKNGTGTADSRVYEAGPPGGFPLAEITLKVNGPSVTKLAVFSMQDWKVESVRPVFAPHDLHLTLPDVFSLRADGKEISPEQGTPAGNQIEYTLSGLYLMPELEIQDPSGASAEYRLQGDRVLVRSYDYSMDVPEGIRVSVNGTPSEGELLSGGKRHHSIRYLNEPKVTLSDDYGNTVEFDPKAGLPLTEMTVQVPQDYTVRVGGAEVPEAAVSCEMNPDYAAFAEYVPDVLQTCTYRIAVLQEDAGVTVADAEGTNLPLPEGEQNVVFALEQPALQEIPEEISSQVDVLKVAQNWSLFMSNDLPFSRLAGDLLEGSYQYQVAKKYANSIDIQFTSKHSLGNPPFTDISVKNFIWITDSCFSVDISFVKHIRVAGMRDEMLDPMNDRFYFVRQEDAAGNADWKLVSMKEMIQDAE